MINSVTLVGRLGRDPELRYTTSGVAVTSLALAVDRNRKSEDGKRPTDWFDIVVWGRSAEFAAQYLKKGQVVGVEGRLQVDRWEKDGQRRQAIRVIANHVQAITWGENTRAAAPGDAGGPFNEL